MMLFISEICKIESKQQNETAEEDDSTKWTHQIESGGLWHINQDTYQLFYVIEEEILKHLKRLSIYKLNCNTKKKILAKVLKNEEVCSQWHQVWMKTLDQSCLIKLQHCT